MKPREGVQTAWVIARFSQPSALVAAAHQLRASGYTAMEAHSPFPIPAIQEAMEPRRSAVPTFCLLGGLAGLATGVLIQWYCNAYDFPINVGGRPILSLPTYVPICFELGVLFASFSALFAALILGGLPQPYHPFFHSHAFLRATTDSFVLGVCPREPGTQALHRLAQALEDLGALELDELEGG